MKWAQGDFNFDSGREQANNGMEKASKSGRGFSWQVDAGRWFMLLPVGTEFSADDATRANGLPSEGVNRNNVIGAFFNGLARSGFIRWTGRTIKSSRIDRHTGMNRIWVKIK